MSIGRRPVSAIMCRDVNVTCALRSVEIILLRLLVFFSLSNIIYSYIYYSLRAYTRIISLLKLCSSPSRILVFGNRDVAKKIFCKAQNVIIIIIIIIIISVVVVVVVCHMTTEDSPVLFFFYYSYIAVRRYRRTNK